MREIDPRDCQHGEADATQEHVEQLQARIAQLEEALQGIIVILNKFDYEGDEDSNSYSFFSARLNEDEFFYKKNKIEALLATKEK